ncbi:hypothetical protein AB0M43_16325 [Longispora sp. NPDC051575]|uniref:hypothetical protein n=1 Tax=Longispora sp. NPDC051575 TaxID=3154943 RepID=UPI003442DF7C
MTTLSAPRRLLAAAALAALTSGVALVTTGTSATANTLHTLVPTSVSYVDSASPDGTLPPVDGAVPVGTWKDGAGTTHTARAFATYDVRALKGLDVRTAQIFTRHTKVDDCSAPRQTEFRWTQTPDAPPTWTRQPAELNSLKVIDFATRPGCPADYVAADVVYGVGKAVRGGADTFTVELRVPKGVEKDARLTQWYDAQLHLSVQTNAAPATPWDASVEGKACQGEDKPFVRTTEPELRVRFSDPDANDRDVKVVFAVWPVDAPGQRFELEGRGRYSDFTSAFAALRMPAGRLVGGTTYAVAVRSTDAAGGESAWSGGCRFTTDLVAPATAPSVTSDDYRDIEHDSGYGGIGVPGTFVFSANGDKDVAGFAYAERSGRSGYVAADHRGGKATYQLTPYIGSQQSLSVWSVDRAGNRSPERVYTFGVPFNQPYFTDGNPGGGIGEARVLTLRPTAADVVEYTYWLGEGPHLTVPAGADHTAAVTIVPESEYLEIRVQARRADGRLTGISLTNLHVDTSPRVVSAEYPADVSSGGAGVTGTFTFQPRQPGVVSYVYSFDFGVEETVPAGADGTASITWTPETGGSDHWLSVRGVLADGTTTSDNYHYFLVN